MGTKADIGETTGSTGTQPGPTPSVKLAVPKLPGRFLGREQLEDRLDEAATHRVTAVVAAAGFGKSTQLAARARANGWCWYTIDAGDAVPSVLAQGLADALRRGLGELEGAVVPTGSSGADHAQADQLAASLAHALEVGLTEQLVLVVDDVHELGRDATAVRILEALVRYAPPEFHLVLSSRDEIPFSIARLRAQGNVLDFDGSDFAFSPSDVRALLASALGRAGADLASPLQEITAGWPVAVQFAIEMLSSIADADRAAALNALATRRGPLFMFLAEEIFGREPPEVRDLLKVIAQFDRVTPALCLALDFPAADVMLEDLAQRGLLAEAGETYTLHALIRQFALTTWSVPAAEARELHRRAGAWFEAHGDAVAAAKAFTVAGDQQALVRLLEASWLQLDNAADVETILAAARVLPRSERGAWALLVAHALIIQGNTEEADRWLASTGSEQAAGVAFLEAVAHMHRCEHREAVERFLVARDRRGTDVDSHCSSFIANELIYLGRLDDARPFLAEAIAAAASDTNPAGAGAETRLVAGDLAYAEGDLPTALALAEEGAARYSELGNVLGECSAQLRRAKVLALLGRLDEALEVSEIAARLSERIGFSQFQPWTSQTRGLLSLLDGRLDAAADDFAASVSASERLGSHGVAEALVGLGDVHRARGELAQARSAYERALAAAERSGTAATKACASSGLARLLVDDDPLEAAALADSAVQLAPGVPERIEARLAQGWIAIQRGDVQGAADAAAAALAEARRTASPAMLAEALELATFAARDPVAEAEQLREAVGIRRRQGNPLAEATAELALASLAAAPDEQARAEQTLRELGVQRNRAAAGLMRMAPSPVSVPLAIETLGRFTVLRDGVAVTHAEWQSKKARDLLKILITRRGQTTPRDYLIELLWPEDDPARTSKRLAVAANVLRNVLDPGRLHGSEHFVVGGVDGFRLDLAQVAVDVEEFLRLGKAALVDRRQPSDDGVRLLEAAESVFAGEFLPEDRYEDWAAPLRDEVRSMYLQVVRLLATQAVDQAAAVRYLLRLLALDPFDEEAHLGLIATFAQAGMHGEARRAYRRYVERMGDLGLEPAAYEQAAVSH